MRKWIEFQSHTGLIGIYDEESRDVRLKSSVPDGFRGTATKDIMDYFNTEVLPRLRKGEVLVTISQGHGKYGEQYAYIRPAKPCANRSRRVEVHEVEKWIRIIYPEVHYWRVGGLVIGAKDEDQAWREYWRVCERSQIRKKEVEISKLEL